MVIGFIGDMHGRAFHALAALLKWQAMRGQPFDMVVQVGDLGVLPNPENGQIPYDRFSLWDPSVYDLWHVFLNKDEVPKLMKEVKAYLPSPIFVVTGNHDEFTDIRYVLRVEPHSSAPLDPYGIFACVPDGFTVDLGDKTIGFCEGTDLSVFEQSNNSRLDILVSHEGGFGPGAEENKLAVGSNSLLEFLRNWKPNYHIFGHFHHPVGPRAVYETMCIQLSSVVSDPRRDRPVMERGGLGVLDTETGCFEFLDDEWLNDFTRINGYQKLRAIVADLKR